MHPTSSDPSSGPVNRDSPLSLGIFLGILLGVVLVPLIMAVWPKERARWLLAQAANVFELSSDKNDQQWKKTQEILDRARSIDRGVTANPNYVALRLLAGPLDASRAMALLDEAPDTVTKSRHAIVFSNLFFEKKEFEAAFDILKRGLPPLESRNAMLNNQFAYFASLVGSDLDEALASIDKALDFAEDSTFLDTKAWVHFQRQEFEEALAAIDAAIQLYAVEITKIPLNAADRKRLKAFIDEGQALEPREEENVASALRGGTALRRAAQTMAVYHYHRAEILKKLDRSEDAEHEYAWLKKRGFANFDELY